MVLSTPQKIDLSVKVREGSTGLFLKSKMLYLLLQRKVTIFKFSLYYVTNYKYILFYRFFESMLLEYCITYHLYTHIDPKSYTTV